MEEIRFWKVHGNGNDFVLLDDRSGELEAREDLPSLAVRACARRTGLGAVVVPTPQGWQWHADLGNGRLLWRLRQELGVWLEPVALPRRLRCLNALPCNAQGKRQYAELKELFDEA